MFCIGLSPMTVFASGQSQLFGVMADDIAWIGASTANIDSAAAAALQPAGISNNERARIVITPHISLNRLDVTFNETASQGRLAPVSVGNGISLGGAIPIGGPFKKRLALGFSLFSPAGNLAIVRVHDPARPYWFRYDGAADRLQLFLGASVQINDWLKIGVGTQAQSQQYSITNIDLDLVGGRYDRQEGFSRQGNSLAPHVGVIIRLQQSLSSRFQLSARWAGSTRTVSQLVNDVELSGLDTALFLTSIVEPHFTPQTFELNLLSELSPKAQRPEDINQESFSVMLGARYEQWSGAPTPFADLQSLTVGGPLEDLGLSEGLTSPLPGLNRAVQIGFRDTLSIHTGLQWRWLSQKHQARLAYGYRPTPVPRQTGVTSLIDADTHLVGAGYRYRFEWRWLQTGPLDIGFSLQSHFQTKRITEKESAFDQTGDYTSRGSVHRGVLTLGIQF